MYKVKLDSFQGPLDLLYKMVKKNKIEINEISLASLTEQYLEYTGYFQSFNLAVATEFMVIASELIQLKARTLLPAEKVVAEEAEESNLVQRLQDYEKFKNISGILKDYKRRGDAIFYRPAELTNLTEDEYQIKLDLALNDLKKVYQNLLINQEQPTDSGEENKFSYLKFTEIKVRDRKTEIIDYLQYDRTAGHFFDFIKDDRNFLEIVVTLLAILELINAKKVKATQSQLFSEISVELRN